VKPFVGLAGLEENIITSKTSFHTTGRLLLPNKWNPKKPTIFSD
jgi:cell division protein FtsI/penicillin-binding protein 2